MKKLLCGIVCMLCSLTMVAQSNLAVTIQRNGQSMHFVGDSSFLEAYNAAIEGDSVLLSPGLHLPVDTINKTLRIIGAGGITGNITRLTKRDSVTNLMVSGRIKADNSYFEGVDFWDHTYLYESNNCTFKRCRIYWMDSIPGMNHTNTTLEQCYIYYERSMSHAVNYQIRNTYIGNIQIPVSSNLVTIFTNCWLPNYFRRYSTNSYWSNYTYIYNQPAIYRNCILGLNANAQDSPEKQFDESLDFQFPAISQYYYNYFYRYNSAGSRDADPSYYIHYTFEPGCIHEGNVANLESASAISCDLTHYAYEWYPDCYGSFNIDKPYIPDMLGSDGTPVGLTGGELGWEPYPGIPRFTYHSLSSRTDVQGQLRVYGLKVKAEKAHPTDNPSVAQFEYWVDDPNGEGQVVSFNERPGPNDTVSIDIQYFDFEHLSIGEHVLYMRLQDTYGAYSPLYVHVFTRRNPYDEELYLPYDATELEGDQQTANPYYMAYPTEMESQMPELNCN